MQGSFFDSQLCKSRERCRQCRRSRDYRRGIVAAFEEPTDEEFECPFGKTTDDFPQGIEPGLFEMAKNFTKSVTDEVRARRKNKITGKRRKVTQEERDKRMSICRGCEFLRGLRCAKCGCNMNIKTRLVSGNCPMGKW